MKHILNIILVTSNSLKGNIEEEGFSCDNIYQVSNASIKNHNQKLSDCYQKVCLPK